METSANQEGQGIILKEYGRNVYKIVNYILTIEDREKRSRFARTLIELMKQLNPAMRDSQDSYPKLWDHLYIMSGYKLDVDTPFPMPEVSLLGKKPMNVAYNTHNLSFKHYGRNIELLIEKAIVLEEQEEQEAAIIYICKLMKRFYASWNKDNIEDELILEHLRIMSKNKLSLPLEKVKAEGLFDTNYREPREYKQTGSLNGSGTARKGRKVYEKRKGN